MKIHHVNTAVTKNLRWTLSLALVIALVTSLVYPALPVRAATSPISLSRPTDIEFYKTSDGQTEMLIADTGNNRVIRATPEGEVLSTMAVNNVTAVTMGSDGLIYAAESGASLQLHIFDPDGTVEGEPIDIARKLSIYTGDSKKPYIRNVMRFKQDQNEVIYILYTVYSTTNNIPESYTIMGDFYLGGTVIGGVSGNFTEYSGATQGTSYFPWYTTTQGVYLSPLAKISNRTDKLGDLARDLANNSVYVVSENKIMRAGYEGFVYPNGPVLSDWVNGNETYPIDLGNQIGVGPKGEVYMADTARDRIVVFSADGTSVSTLGLNQDDTPKPAAGAFSKTVKQGLPVEFTVTDFESNYADSENRLLSDIRISSLPDSGTLQLNGTDVVKNQVIPAEALNTLRFIPSNAFTGLKTSFSWQAKNGTVFSDRASVTLMLRIKGDTSGDGLITPADALLVNKYIKGLITFTPSQIEALDMNDDGVLDAKDSSLIMGIYLGINI
ncbi:dockerin type I domain-containing protein [Paenibacillus silvae]|uniref:Dockerin domain-containing protein n=1 Tax=Paenibacillus silvae TaxID=1325358 RepID=A0A2W6NHA4_9BACL|nr:dockerin type I domain-containing protein [Paenibacillus silvae]PZT55161.1 hypothetical protein DN757_13480 [Paenibacillus silvae]